VNSNIFHRAMRSRGASVRPSVCDVCHTSVLRRCCHFSSPW